MGPLPVWNCHLTAGSYTSRAASRRIPLFAMVFAGHGNGFCASLVGGAGGANRGYSIGYRPVLLSGYQPVPVKTEGTLERVQPEVA